jgi:Flp pilus assembly protein TadG
MNLRRLHADERGGLISGFIIRTVIVFGLLILGLEEIGQVIWTQVRVSNAAGAAAQAGADSYAATKSVNEAEKAAVDAAYADNPKAKVTSVVVNQDGSVTVTAQLTAPTLIIQRISFLKKYGLQHSTQQATHSLA